MNFSNFLRPSWTPSTDYVKCDICSKSIPADSRRAHERSEGHCTKQKHYWCGTCHTCAKQKQIHDTTMKHQKNMAKAGAAMYHLKD